MLVESLPFVAFAFSAGAGTFFAPCAYPLLPGYLSYYLGQTTGEPATDGGTGRARSGPGTGRVATTVAAGIDPLVPGDYAPRVVRAAVVGLLVSLGFVVVYGVLAGVAVAAGSRLLADISLLEPVVAAVLIVVGTATVAGYDLPTPAVRLPERRRSATGFVGFGVVYAAAAAGCTGTVFVGISLQAIASGPVVAGATLAAYAGGMSLLMIAVTVAAALGRDTLLTRVSARAGLIERVMGALLILAGLAQLYFFLFRFDGLETLGLA